VHGISESFGLLSASAFTTKPDFAIFLNVFSR